MMNFRTLSQDELTRYIEGARLAKHRIGAVNELRRRAVDGEIFEDFDDYEKQFDNGYEIGRSEIEEEMVKTLCHLIKNDFKHKLDEETINWLITDLESRYGLTSI